MAIFYHTAGEVGNNSATTLFASGIADLARTLTSGLVDIALVAFWVIAPVILLLWFMAMLNPTGQATVWFNYLFRLVGGWLGL